MSSDAIQDIKDNPEAIIAAFRQGGGNLLSDLLPGNDNASIREKLIEKGVYVNEQTRRSVHVQTRPIPGTTEYEVMAVAAVSRDPGASVDYIKTIADFLPRAIPNRALDIAQLWRIYTYEGIVNNAVNKIAATLSSTGSFKVKNAKKGKMKKAREILQAVLDDFVDNVNNARDDGAVTGSRGLQAVTLQAVRMALVEGSWIGRTVWGDKHILVDGSLKVFQVPINIQSLTTAEVEPVPGLSSINFEAFYWKPSQDVVKLLQTKPADLPKPLRNTIKKFLTPDVANEIKKTGKLFLDPALLVHVKHRPIDTQPFGDSFVRPAMQAIAFKRSVEALDMVSMQNLIKRLTIITVGNGDPKSPYSKPEVQQARTALMQSLLEDPGPNMTLVWQGDDVKVTDVGDGDALSLNDRHTISESKVKIALGVPDALLSGTTGSGDSKAAGWASALGAAAELLELQNAFKNAWTTIGQRIADQNNFQDVDIIYEFSNSIMVDKADEWAQLRQDAVAGLVSIQTFLKGRGYDPEAEYALRCYEQGLDPDPENPNTTYQKVFMPMQGLPGQGGDAAPPGLNGKKVPGSGRTPNADTGAPPAPAKAPPPKTAE